MVNSTGNINPKIIRRYVKKMEYNREVELDIIDLFKWLLQYWYIFLVVIILGFIAGGSYASHNNSIMDATTLEMKISKVLEKLTPGEIKEVDDIFEKINLAQEKRDELASAMTSAGYSGDDLENAIKSAEYWNDLYSQQRSLANSLVKYQKEYYDLLTFDPDKEPEHDNVVLYAIIGGLAIALITLIAFSGYYIITNTVKTSDELTFIYHNPVLIQLSGKNAEEELLSTDISILMKNASLKKLAILIDTTCTPKNDFSEKLAKAITTILPNTSVAILDPLSSASELSTLSECDAVVPLVYIKKTSRSRLRDLISYCERYGCTTLGFVTINSAS